jgi:hypothetical protein
MIDEGCNINGIDQAFNTPLFYAIRSFKKGTDVSILHYLISASNMDLNQPGLGRGLLDVACYNINNIPLEIFKDLIEVRGISTKGYDHFSDTPFHTAFRNYKRPTDTAVLEYLLSISDLDSSIRGDGGDSLLHAVCYNISQLSIDFFKQIFLKLFTNLFSFNNLSVSPFHVLVQNFSREDDVQFLDFFCDFLTQIHQQDGQTGRIYYDETLLRCACFNVNNIPLKFFKFIIESTGIKLNTKTIHKKTPLSIFIDAFDIDYGDINTLKYLLKLYGIDLPQIGPYNNFLQKLKQFISFNQTFLLTEYLLQEKLIQNDTNSFEYLLALCSFPKPDLSSIKYLFLNISCPYFDYNLLLQSLPSDSPHPFPIHLVLTPSDQVITFSIGAEPIEDSSEADEDDSTQVVLVENIIELFISVQFQNTAD